jgi:hypothetical protein
MSKLRQGRGVRRVVLSPLQLLHFASRALREEYGSAALASSFREDGSVVFDFADAPVDELTRSRYDRAQGQARLEPALLTAEEVK